MNGFTLLEVLIAVAIMAGIVTVIYASFATASRNVEHAEAKRDATDLARVLLTRLSNEISNAYYDPATSTVEKSFFYGKKSGVELDIPRFDSIAFTTQVNHPYYDDAVLVEVGYWFEEIPEKNGRMLIRKEKRELMNSSPLEGGNDTALTDRIKSLRIRYFNGTTWTDDWDTRNQSSVQKPTAVEITLMLDEGSLYSMQVEVGRR